MASPAPAAASLADSAPAENYKWIVLSNTTIGMLLVTINSSILLIAPRTQAMDRGSRPSPRVQQLLAESLQQPFGSLHIWDVLHLDSRS